MKTEVKTQDAKLEAAGKPKNGAPPCYLLMIVVQYFETKNVTMLPVLCSMLTARSSQLR